MANDLRKSGIGTVGDIPWGTHFCHFYENKVDLLDVLIPYFQAGLEHNEFCVWRVFDPLDAKEARNALERVVPGCDQRLAAGDIEIVPQSEWYRDWEAKLDNALAKGYAGMRVNVDAASLAPTDFSGLIINRRMILLCAYPLSVKHAAEIFDAGHTHRFAIARRNGNWQVVETPELSEARAEVRRLNAELGQRAIERTEELSVANSDKKHKAAALLRAQQALQVCGERSLCYFELGLVGMAIVSPTAGSLEVNQRFCDILGYTRLEITQMPWAALTHPDDRARDAINFGRIVAGEIDGYLITKRWIRKNGDAVHANVSVKCQRHEDGSVNYLAAMIEEVPALDP